MNGGGTVTRCTTFVGLYKSRTNPQPFSELWYPVVLGFQRRRTGIFVGTTRKQTTLNQLFRLLSRTVFCRGKEVPMTLSEVSPISRYNLTSTVFSNYIYSFNSFPSFKGKGVSLSFIERFEDLRFLVFYSYLYL